jgi:hypothetical protein
MVFARIADDAAECLLSLFVNSGRNRVPETVVYGTKRDADVGFRKVAKNLKSIIPKILTRKSGSTHEGFCSHSQEPG